MYALFERIDDDTRYGKTRVVVTRFQVTPNVSENKTSIYRPLPIVTPSDESHRASKNSLITDNPETYVYRENIIFVYLDVNTPVNRDLIRPLRAINDDVHIYSNVFKCLDFLQYSNDKIFFITTSNDKDLIKNVHDCPAIEAIFIWNSDVQIDKNRFSKLVGTYTNSKELLTSARNAFEWFEQTQLELIVFEHDQLFLWLQLWREFIKPSNPRVTSTKEKFVDMAENYYRGNTKLLKSLDEFDYCYERNDVLQWCFNSPFPSSFIHHALSCRNTEHIDLCRFLINDISHVLHQPVDSKGNRQFFRGMKVTNDGLEKLIKHTGKLICPKGFFTCNKSRRDALSLARSSDYRPDLHPVLFKINCPPSVPLGEVPSTDSTTGLVVFDVYTTFRVKCVNRGPVTIVKLEPAGQDGRNLAREYRMKFKSENLYTLLDQLAALPKPPPQLPPLKLISKMKLKKATPRTLSKEEMRAHKFVQHGKIDRGLSLYQNLRTQTPQALNIMGQLYADKKGDYNTAMAYYKQAMKIQERSGEDISETLTQLGIVHYNRREFDLALSCHKRALNLQKNNPITDQTAVASSLLGIANAQWGKNNLSKALKTAQKALTLNESIEYENDLNLAMNLAVLANIHHKAGDYNRALEFSKRALVMLEPCVSPDSLTLASVLNNMGAIQMKLGLLFDARQTFDRARIICEKNLPEGHPKRVIMETNIIYINEIIKQNGTKA